MILYGLTTKPFIRKVKALFKDLVHIWYADDGNAGGTFKMLRQYLRSLTTLGLPYGFYLDPNKCTPLLPPPTTSVLPSAASEAS
jgi:hypothetical protein